MYFFFFLLSLLLALRGHRSCRSAPVNRSREQRPETQLLLHRLLNNGRSFDPTDSCSFVCSLTSIFYSLSLSFSLCLSVSLSLILSQHFQSLKSKGNSIFSVFFLWTLYCFTFFCHNLGFLRSKYLIFKSKFLSRFSVWPLGQYCPWSSWFFLIVLLKMFMAAGVI